MEYSTRAKKAFLGLVFGLLTAVAGTGQVVASTADGQTPANEGICDSLQGATPGLYGLCVAYCEAQDLDLVGDKEPPNSRILDNYRKKMRAGDPDMPCVATPCPCWDASEISNITATGTAACASTAAIAQVRNETTFAQIDTGRPLCRYVDRATATQRLNTGFTAEEAQSCYNIVIDACAVIGQ